MTASKTLFYWTAVCAHQHLQESLSISSTPIYSLIQNFKVLKLFALQEGEGRPESIFRLDVIPLNLLQRPQ